MYDRMVVAKNLRFYRGAIFEITQMELSERLNLSVSSVRRYERGEADAPLDYLIAFADSANISLDSLVGREIDSISVEGLTEEQKRVEARRIAKLREENQKKK